VGIRRSRTVTGLDIGSTSVKAVRLAHRKTGVKLAGVAAVDIPALGWLSGDNERQDRPVIEAIREALERCGAVEDLNAPVVTGLGGTGVSVKHVAFPDMSVEDMGKSIQWEARKHVPFSGANFVLDFQVVGRTGGEEEGELQVLLAAVDARLLESHIETLEEVGVEPDVVDLTPLALLNEADERGLINGEALAVIDLGASTVTLTAYRRGGLFFTRSFRISRIRPKSLTGPEHDAGDAKASDVPGGDAAGPKATPDNDPWLKDVLTEVKRSLIFYHNQTEKRGIDRIYLTGGNALVPGTAEAFSSTLGVATDVLDPLEGVDASGVNLRAVRDQGTRFAVAMGLARRV
jgi:type IV pilus assembly protein PilM